MILEKEIIDEASSGIEASVKSNINKDSLAFVFTLVTEKFYSNPIGSLIREITSNCRDANTESGTDKPIIINLQKDVDNNQFYIEFVDHGFGMDRDRLDNIYMNWFTSTKRDDNSQIGGFGIGSKSPLAYADYFQITTVRDGVKNICLLSKATDGPILDYLSTEETDEPNGTKVKIDIQYHDYDRFLKEITLQLAYFDDIYVNLHHGYFDNAYQIIEGDTFKYRTKFPNSYEHRGLRSDLHLVIDVVNYPINWNLILGSSLYSYEFKRIPFALTFNVGELDVTPNREQLQYSTKTIEAISVKLVNFYNELKNRVAAKFQDTDDLETYLKLRYSGCKLTLGDEVVNMPVEFKRKVSFTKLYFSDQLDTPDNQMVIPQSPYFEYAVTRIQNGRSGESQMNLDADDNVQSFLFAESTDIWNNRYHDNARVITPTVIHNKPKEYRRVYYKTLNLKPTIKLDRWKKVLIYRKMIREYIESKAAPYDQVTEEFQEEWRDLHRVQRRVVVNVEFYTPGNYRVERSLEQLAEYMCIFYDVVDRASSSSTRMLYTQKLISRWSKESWTKRNKLFLFMTVNKGNWDKIKSLPNIKPIEEFNQAEEFQNFLTKTWWADTIEDDLLYKVIDNSPYYYEIQVKLRAFRNQYKSRDFDVQWHKPVVPTDMWQVDGWIKELEYYMKGVEPLKYLHWDAPEWLRKEYVRKFIHLPKLTIKQDKSYESYVQASWANNLAISRRVREQADDQRERCSRPSDLGDQSLGGESLEDSREQGAEGALPEDRGSSEGEEREGGEAGESSRSSEGGDYYSREHISELLSSLSSRYERSGTRDSSEEAGRVQEEGRPEAGSEGYIESL